MTSPLQLRWNSVNTKPLSVKRKQEKGLTRVLISNQCAPWSCLHLFTVGGKNAKLIIQLFKNSFTLNGVWGGISERCQFMRKKSTLKFLVFIYFSFIFIRNLWRVCAYGEDRYQKKVEKYKCLICCCTWNLVSIIYIVRFSTCPCPVSLITCLCVCVCFTEKVRKKEDTSFIPNTWRIFQMIFANHLACKNNIQNHYF